MNFVRLAKHGIFDVARRIGAPALVRRSRWRRDRLLILCFHGVSLDDEHLWKPTLFIRQDVLRERLAQLRDGGYSVVSLDEGVRRMQDGTLPEGAVALTFDDGTYDFLSRAFPVLREFGFPATVYQTTRYSQLGVPVFDVFVAYLLWKAREQAADLSAVVPGAPAGGLGSAQQRDRALWAVLDFAERERLDEGARHRLVEQLAAALGIDLAPILQRRILSLMNATEVAELAQQGIDFQLHTHRHHLFEDRASFDADLRDNRSFIEAATGRTATHFCYPSGVYRTDAQQWLRESGVISATTCDPGFANREGSPMLLPRLVVTEQLSALVFESWVSGLAALLPRRTQLAHPQESER